MSDRRLTTTDSLVRDFSEVSSGTLATLSGLRKYSDLDALRAEIVEALPASLAARPGGFANFFDFWKFYEGQSVENKAAWWKDSS